MKAILGELVRQQDLIMGLLIALRPSDTMAPQRSSKRARVERLMIFIPNFVVAYFYVLTAQQQQMTRKTIGHC